MLYTEKVDQAVYKRIKGFFLFLSVIFFLISLVLKDSYWIDIFIRTYIANTFIIALIASLIISLFSFKFNKGIISYILVTISYFLLSFIWLWSITIIFINGNAYLVGFILIINTFLGIGLMPLSLILLYISNQTGLILVLIILIFIRFIIYYLGYILRQKQLKPLKNNLD